MAAPNVYLIKMRHSSISCCLLYVLQLYVHVVLGLQQLSSVDLARGEFERNDVALREVSVVLRDMYTVPYLSLVQKFYWDANGRGELAHLASADQRSFS